MKTIAIIPARYASSRFPGKPLADIAGKTMIQRVYEQTNKAFENVCVATDDERIFNEVKRFGGIPVMTSEKHKSGTDRVYEAYLKYTASDISDTFDVIMNVQGDEPLIDPHQLLALEKVFDNPDVQIGTMAKKITSTDDLFDRNNVKVILDKNEYAIYFSRTPIPCLRDSEENVWKDKFDYLKHIGLYAYRPAALKQICSMERTPLEIAESLEQLRWIENGLKIRVQITECESISIDTPSDLTKLLEYLNKK